MAQITDDVFRAQAVFQGSSGLPRDRYVNTFHFVRKGAVQLDLLTDMDNLADEVATRVHEFYATPVPNGVAIGTYLSSYINRPYQVRVYSLAENVPNGQRTPYVREKTLPAQATAGVLPMETAISVSFFAGRNQKRLRGRIFLGPLGQSVLDTGSNLPLVVPAVRGSLRQACERLAAEGVGDRLDWAVFSPTDNEARGVTGGWIDNDFDTIRARGPKAGARSTWPT
jgi:hypothetical protein